MKDTYTLEMSGGKMLDMLYDHIDLIQMHHQNPHTTELQLSHGMNFMMEESSIDDMMKEQLKPVDDIIASIDTNKTDIEVLLGVLTITLPYKKYYSSRPQFFEETKMRIWGTDGVKNTAYAGLE